MAPRAPGAPRRKIPLSAESKKLVREAERIFPEARIAKMQMRDPNEENQMPHISFYTH
jgi:hypothetical protein